MSYRDDYGPARGPPRRGPPDIRDTHSLLVLNITFRELLHRPADSR